MTALTWLWASVLLQPVPVERLVAPMPPGFQVGYSAEVGSQAIEERVPAGESIDRWTRMVTVQRLGRLATIGSHAFLTRMGGLWTRACPGATVSPISDGEVEGRPVASFRVDCPLNPQTGQPETMFARAFAGASDLHIVQYAFRSVPGAAEARAALAYLDSVRL